MDQNMMALLTAVLSGQSQPLSGQQRQAPMQQPMISRPQQTGMPMQTAQTSIGMRPNEHGNDGGVSPNVNPGLDDGEDKNGNGGKAGNNKRLSDFEKKMRAIANKGPKAYTPAIKKNLGFGQPTIGYGKEDPSSFKTGMADSLASVLNGTPEPQPATNKLPTWI